MASADKPHSSAGKRPAKSDRVGLVRSVTNPLGFYVLVLILIESVLGIFTAFKLTEEHTWQGFLAMAGCFALIVVIVTLFAVFAPKRLLGTREDHFAPLDRGALQDGVEEIILKKVKPECLK
jgi:hypothetical protein